ncbi:MAG: 30S ribosomal protein S5 [Patescibacteria group bacterium]|nr:30S ribosomal protein S5 [Patescibacteria group bacterium]
MAHENRQRERKEFDQTVVDIARVTRVVAGGKRMRFRALVVLGDKKGSVGMAVKKGADVSEAVNKAATAAKKQMLKVPITGSTIPHEVIFKYKASKILLKPAKPGTGVIAGGSVRAVVEAAGISDILSKSLGSSNKINIVKAVFGAFSKLKTPVKVQDK